MPRNPNLKRYDDRQPDQSPEVPPRDEEVDAALDAALAAQWGPSPMVYHELVSLTVHLDLTRHEPPGRAQAIVVTRGVSDKPTSPPEGAGDAYRWIELFVRLPPEWPIFTGAADTPEEVWWPGRWLKQLGRFVHEYRTWLADLHTVPNGEGAEPFVAGSQLCCWLLVAPEGADAPVASILAGGRRVQLLELVPITREEMEYKLAAGGEALRERLRTAGILGHPLAPGRASCVSAQDLAEARAADQADQAAMRATMAAFAKAAGAAIATTRTAYAASGRAPGMLERWFGGLRAPSWLPADDALRRIYDDQWRLRRDGRVVWGHIVQANALLFEPGSGCHPAAAIWSPDPWYDGNLPELAAIAGGMYETKGESTGDPALQRFADLLADEMERQMRLPLPAALTGGRKVFYTTIMVHREHLPEPVLKVPFFPLLACPTGTDATAILPSRWWSPQALQLWRHMAE